MKYYFVAQIKINDPLEYQKYLDNVDDVFDKFKGKYLAVDESPEVIEGEWNYTKSVIIEFENKNDFNEWYYSDDYQRILSYRLKASVSDSILVEGM
jgi:uncharacterized protein (DUF1330 family)